MAGNTLRAAGPRGAGGVPPAEARRQQGPNAYSGLRTVRTGQGAVRSTRSATLPSSTRLTPPRPSVPMTTRSARSSAASATISAWAGPFRITVRTVTLRFLRLVSPPLELVGDPLFSFEEHTPRGGATELRRLHAVYRRLHRVCHREQTLAGHWRRPYCRQPPRSRTRRGRVNCHPSVGAASIQTLGAASFPSLSAAIRRCFESSGWPRRFGLASP